MEDSQEERNPSWKNFPIQQQPIWPDKAELESAIETIKTFPPLVSTAEVIQLREELAAIERDGKGFILQGGDCAERFLDLKDHVIESKIRLLLQMASVLGHSTQEHCTIIARIAGQYGKPRSSNPKTEDVRAVFRGDNIHGYDVGQRRPDPQRLVRGYFTSAASLNYIRTLMKDGFERITHFPQSWDLSFINSKKESMVAHKETISRIFDNTYLCRHNNTEEPTKTNIYSSHEAILLDYEDAMTREVNGKLYNLSAPFVWIGDRTRQLDHAHVEYVRTIENPIGIKVGPTMEPEELIMLLRLIWPHPEKSPGKVTLITRYGINNVEKCLPRHIEAVQRARFKVLWVCDPCHGNTRVCKENGFKTRDFKTIFEEISKVLAVHRRLGSRLSGIHLEMTGDDVTECVGGIQNIKEDDLPTRFESYCDPRLNYSQSMELSLQMAKILCSEDKKVVNPSSESIVKG